MYFLQYPHSVIKCFCVSQWIFLLFIYFYNCGIFFIILLLWTWFFVVLLYVLIWRECSFKYWKYVVFYYFFLICSKYEIKEIKEILINKNIEMLILLIYYLLKSQESNSFLISHTFPGDKSDPQWSVSSTAPTKSL